MGEETPSGEGLLVFLGTSVKGARGEQAVVREMEPPTDDLEHPLPPERTLGVDAEQPPHVHSEETLAAGGGLSRTRQDLGMDHKGASHPEEDIQPHMEILNQRLRALPKADLLRILTGRCRHGTTICCCDSCLGEVGKDKKERIGFLDIEASSLKADFGILLSYCIKEHGRKTYGSKITTKELRSPLHDRRLTEQCVADMERFDRLITFYGSRYDIPFLRSRALYHRLRFPERGSIYHTDCYDWVKHKLRLHGNRLQFACDHLGIASKGHKLDPKHWNRALSGDQVSLNYIFTHNKEDVESLEELYNRLLPFCTLTKTSI